MMKRKYIVPEVELTRVDIESALLDGSKPEVDAPQTFAKEHNPIFGFWDEEEEKPMFQQPKSLWD